MIARLNNIASQLALSLPDNCIPRLINYVALIARWNTVINLTAVRGDMNICERHIADSMSCLPYFPSTKQRICDVGSGAGLPGVVFALCRPDCQVDCVDASEKRADFMQQAKLVLKLTNVTVICERVERLSVQPYSLMVSRAFSSLEQFCRLSARHLSPQGELWAMKGRYPEAEIAALPTRFRCIEVIPLSVPGLSESRHLVRVHHNA